ncbi:PstS family phosphate ABC transporter substrate-binding protein [Flavobacterium gawalongense]|uniref:Phosphate ABC transporter substrate-binding protein n=1 Tax=Flavobacterium gawalongense TaxID=2594432 RepID=A0A553BUK0_9FLAO|nr:substrate-binding domain-containing protein [Flavobacterium gawalongense]TRX02368.1 phosphate ABC transporter substrate-binding protein [Flavobacterium gawalongense]TRX06434.1 phosphate ABC transporter substrate-binding protein [Flavobacterium gawalongense]TRX07803.1 phosphate ABC transporter substrate-binding protein [Flavobacterium gawalongense]TRX11929.1 phosphate ABC transporter substrate-binding protein [Flavobacterium gawalongense]TRX30922.1 phosphate ABC transporter substrate-binding
MKNYAKLPYFIFISVIVMFFACNQSKSPKNKETILKGSASIYVDETLTPIIEDQVAVFESKYEAKIKLIPKSESETVNSLFKEESAIAILSRNLTMEELKIFEQRKITPKITVFATDAVAFISNKNNNDTIVALKDVISFMQGKSVASIKGLVFDNPNSSTVRYMNSLAGIKAIPEKGVFSFKTNDEVIKYVSENDGMIGVVGVNWLSQPLPAMQKYVDSVNTLSVKGLTGDNSFTPSQNNIAERKYPLARDLYVINCQGYSGLGMGFASFVAGDIGQRIILKSGLLPIRIPGRNITIRNKSGNDKK